MSDIISREDILAGDCDTDDALRMFDRIKELEDAIIQNQETIHLLITRGDKKEIT